MDIDFILGCSFMNLVLNYFEKTCDRLKEKEAVIYKDETIKYGNLRENGKKIGSVLTSYILNNEPVAVFMDKGINALETFLGILYAGGCYTLINPDFPDARIKQIISVLNNHVVITDEKNEEKAKEVFKDLKVLTIKELLLSEIDENKLKKVLDQKLDIDPVYINFTSGSTGVPKGVIVSNRSIIDFINVFVKEFDINENDLIANQAPFDFDVSVKDIYSSFFVGASLVIVPKEYFSSPVTLLDYLCDKKVTTMIWAVSALCLITTFHGLDYKVPSTIKKVIFSGEVMPIKHLNIWMSKLPDTMFVNVYGPTEITCNCTYHIIDSKRNYDGIIPVGKPFKNEKVFLLDSDNTLIEEPGKIGEICISGSCLALGYYNNWEEINKHFIQNPLNKNYLEMIYKTGDLGRFNDDMELIFSGRKDFQIKYMGHRIELEEIDRMIMKEDGITRVCTIFDDEKNKIYGFYIGDVDAKELKIKLGSKLPIYMLPSKLIKCDEFKMNKNGKIDRKELLRKYKEGC